MTVVTVIKGHDEWEGLYLDGKLETEDHSLYSDFVLEALVGRRVDTLHFAYVDDEWIEERGGLPQSLADIPQDVITHHRSFDTQRSRDANNG